MYDWYLKTLDELYERFSSSDHGLGSIQVAENREKFGPNSFEQGKKVTIFSLLLEQCKGVFVWVLLIAAGIVFALGEHIDGGIILFVIVLNAVIGAIQEGKAQSTLESLKNLASGTATVIRDGKHVTIPDSEVVVGDILILHDGAAVVADARLISSNNLEINESSLTGESTAVHKDAHAKVTQGSARGDQKNMVFRGTHVMGGLGRALVVAVGKNTTIGELADSVADIQKDVPLKKNIESLSYLILWIVGIFSVILFIAGIVTGKTVVEMFIIVVAVAVSAIPESLPVVVTLVLATGVWRMSKQQALVKRLQAVEALGQANVLALDKTGTITKNQMTVEKIFAGMREYTVTGSGYDPHGNVLLQGAEVDTATDASIRFAGYISAFTATARIEFDATQKIWKRQSGDPTEVALLVFAEKLGMSQHEMLEKFPQELEIPFDLHTKHHTTINTVDRKSFLATAGSAEVLLDASSTYDEQGDRHELTDAVRNTFRQKIKQYSQEGYRVLALAYSLHPSKNIDPQHMKNLTFLGFVAIRDAIRPEVYASLEAVRGAGLRPVMITGDYAETAKAIAASVGIYKEGDDVILGSDFNTLPEDELLNRLATTSVFARVEPEQKLQIIQAFKKRGDTIAMTGDGVNDSLSLVAADLGVAMGKIGTDVAKEAADIVLLDDNFGTIAHAVEEGRSIYNTIRKSVLYLLSTNIGELLVIGIAVIIGWPLPLVASQIIWLNMVTDTFLVAALAVEPKEKGLLRRTYRKPTKYIVDSFMAIRITLIGVVMTAATLIMFYVFLPAGITKATTIALCVLTVFQWFNIFNVRSFSESIFSKQMLQNKYLWIALVVVVLLQMAAVYVPFLQNILHTTGLTLREWGIVLLVGLSIIVIEETRKLFARRASVTF